MGLNVSKSISNVTQKIDNELTATAGASSVVQCGIKVGDITLRNAKRCSVRNQNKCGASASAGLDAIAKASAEAFQTASNDLKTKLMPGINISDTTQNIQTEIRNRLSQNCQADSRAALDISSGNITLDGCEDSEIININAGSAEANCGIRTVLDTINKAGNEVNTSASTESLFGGLYGDNLMYGSAFSVICCICSILIICIFSVIIFMRNRS